MPRDRLSADEKHVLNHAQSLGKELNTELLHLMADKIYQSADGFDDAGETDGVITEAEAKAFNDWLTSYKAYMQANGQPVEAMGLKTMSCGELQNRLNHIRDHMDAEQAKAEGDETQLQALVNSEAFINAKLHESRIEDAQHGNKPTPDVPNEQGRSNRVII